jgi:cobalt-zinc-cadmium efflux system outer membrane protein
MLRLAALVSLAAMLILAGCRGIPAPGEKAARRDVQSVESRYRPGRHPPELPPLTPDSGFSNFVAFALLNSPAVEAAFDDWSASVERITVERSMPDPQLTLQAYITDRLSSLMPGLAWNLPGPGKLKARGAVAAAESQGKYFAFESALLQAAFEVKKAFYELHFLDERLRINRETLSLLTGLEQLARAQNDVGKATLQDVLRAQIERDRVANEIINIEDSRRPGLAAFKAALGIACDRADPPVPLRWEPEGPIPDSDELLRIGFSRNPRLKAMEADVRAAEAGIAMAYKEKVPDFNLALMADVKASPVLYWPQAGMSLPLWRDKLAAEIAQARKNELAARARLSGEQIALAVDFAEKSFACRQLSRNLNLLETQLIPKARQSLEIARAGYLSGTIDFFNLIDTERTLLEFQMNAVEARTGRETALAELSLLIAGVPPAGAPVRSATTPAP